LAFEGDMSMFDQTQGFGPLVIWGQRLWKQFGADGEWLALRFRQLRSAYGVHRHGMSVVGKPPLQLPTGIDTTTIDNSVDSLAANVVATLTALRSKDWTPLAWERCMLSLGFISKLRVHDDFQMATFLKGHWIPTLRGGWRWLPLPSAVIKLGKTMTIPEVALRCPGKPDLSRADAQRSLAAGMAASYQHVPVDYPILGPFVAALKRLGGETQRWYVDEELGYRVFPMAGDPIDVGKAADQICARYDCAPGDLARVTELLNRVDSMPMLVMDPLFHSLAAVDYG
jgi:hypothetical protein